MNGTFRPPFPERLDISSFFAGRSQAWGMVIDRRGRALRRFIVDIEGSVSGSELVLDESFRFDDGSTDERVWTIDCAGRTVAGHAHDVVGTAHGQIEGPALTWRYELMLPVGKRCFRVAFDDLMVMADHETLLSRAVIRKFGLRMAEVIIAFRRLPAASTP
jgi:hypothetical protein